MTTIDVVWEGDHSVKELANVIGFYVLGLSRRDPPDPWGVSDSLSASI